MRTTGKQSNRGARGVISKLLLAVALFAFGVASMATAAFYILPLSIAEQRVQDSLRAQGALVSWQSLSRTFPFGLKATGVRVDDISTGSPVVRLEEAGARLDLLGLLSGVLRFPLNVSMGRGIINGAVDIRLQGVFLDMEATGVEIDAIPAVAAMNARTKASVGGTLSVFLPWNGCPAGSMRLRSGRVDGAGIGFMGMPLSLGEIEQAGLNAEFGDCKVVVEGLWVDGSELSAKLAGVLVPSAPLAASRLDMTLEVTPKGDIAGQQWLLSFISPYRRSSNYYYMTIRGTFARPVIGR